MGVSRASFASADQTMALTGMMIGGVTPFALSSEVPIYADEKLMALDYLVLGSGTRSSKIRVVPDVIGRLANARTVAGLSMGPRPP